MSLYPCQPMNPRRLAAASLIAVAGLLATACSGDDSSTTPDTTSAPVVSGATTTTSAEDPGETTIPDADPGDTLPDETGSSEFEAPPDPVVEDTEPPAQEKLPAEGPATVGGVDLPSGHVIEQIEQRLAWITDEPVEDAGQKWLELYRAYPETGLYPVLLVDDDQPAGWEIDSLFPNQPFELDNYNLADVLQFSAENNFDPPRTSNGPGGPSSGPQDADASEALIAALPDARIALVETPRGADAISYMGWTGNATYDTTEAIATAVRSWEERYGARVVQAGPNSLTIAIDRPPANSDEAAALSEELVLLDPDLEAGGAPIPVVELGDGLLGQHLWTLWWLS